jgi:broad specificity phosphatase PhoE
MKRLILVKHSLPAIVETSPARDWILSGEGRARARQLAELLPAYQPELIACSVESKARETASILAKGLGLPVHIVEGLHEHDRSSSPYYSAEKFQALVRKFFEEPDSLVFGSETATESLARFRAAIEAARKFCDRENLIVVSHGTVIALYVSWLTGCDGYSLWQELGLPSFVVLGMRTRTVVKIENLR